MILSDNEIEYFANIYERSNIRNRISFDVFLTIKTSDYDYVRLDRIDPLSYPRSSSNVNVNSCIETRARMKPINRPSVFYRLFGIESNVV